MVIIAETGEQGIKEIQNHTDYNLAFIDIGLPDMSGLEVIRKIKQMNSRIIVIAQTAYAMDKNRTQCLKAGADEYIAKPVNEMNLLRMMKKCMKQ